MPTYVKLVRGYGGLVRPLACKRVLEHTRLPKLCTALLLKATFLLASVGLVFVPKDSAIWLLARWPQRLFGTKVAVLVLLAHSPQLCDVG